MGHSRKFSSCANVWPTACRVRLFPSVVRKESYKPELAVLMINHVGPDCSGPNDAVPYVNLHAFSANLCVAGVFSFSPGRSVFAKRDDFELETVGSAWEKDCYVMAAAQWILWNEQTVFMFIIDDDPNERNYWRLGETFSGSSIEPRSVERWRYWEASFRAVGSNPERNDECKKLAVRTAGFMRSIEEAVLF